MKRKLTWGFENDGAHTLHTAMPSLRSRGIPEPSRLDKDHSTLSVKARAWLPHAPPPPLPTVSPIRLEVKLIDRASS